MPPGSLKRLSSADKDVSPPPAKRRITTTATSSAVADFFKPASEKAPENASFHVVNETLLVGRHKNAQSIPRTKPVKIAAFDFDDTLITTKSGLKFARGDDDWKWWHASVPTRLKDLHAEGYAIVVVSNQAAVSLRSVVKTPKDGMKSLSNLKGKATAVFNALDLPMSLYAATGYDLYRKPRSGMWEQILRDYGLNPYGDVDRRRSVFVGDAAGRAGDKATNTKKDHACSDRDFAANVGIPFQTPEEFFLNDEPKPYTREFDPSTFVGGEMTSRTDASQILFSKKNDLDIVLFCGSPGSGKSTFYWRHLQTIGYERVNQDILKSRDKCMKVAAEYVEQRKSVVVDNTNADIETRAAWVAFAKRTRVPIRLVHFTASAKLCQHNDAVRALGGELVSLQMSAQLTVDALHHAVESLAWTASC